MTLLQATKIALDLKKHLVDNNLLEVKQVLWVMVGGGVWAWACVFMCVFACKGGNEAGSAVRVDVWAWAWAWAWVWTWGWVWAWV